MKIYNSKSIKIIFIGKHKKSQHNPHINDAGIFYTLKYSNFFTRFLALDVSNSELSSNIRFFKHLYK